MTLDDLTRLVSDTIVRDDIDANILNWVDFAEQHISRNVTVGETSVYGQILTDDKGQATLPVDLRRIENIQIAGSETELRLAPASLLDNDRLQSGTPSVYALQGRNILLYPTPEAGTLVQLRYQAKVPSLRAFGETTFANANSDLYLHAVLSYAGPYLREGRDRLVEWKRTRDGIIDDLNSEFARAQISAGAVLIPTTYIV